MNPITLEQKLQRLVDGELTPEDRVHLLEEAEQSPDLFRSIALTFVEHQVCDQAIGDVVTRPMLIACQPVSKPAKSDARVSQRHWRSLAVAGMIALIAWSGGWISALLVSSGATSAPHGDQIAEPGEPDNPDSWNQDAGNRSTSVIDRSTSESLELPVPLPPPLEVVQIDKVMQDIAGNPTVSARDQVALMQAGYRLQEIPAWVPVELEDGKRIDVPVRRLQIQYIGTPLYQ